MGRAPCCEKVGLKKGRWTAEEDEKLVKYIAEHGEGSWRALPKSAGLLRCGKSCRLRWINYLRTDLKRGNISKEEEQIIVKLHSTLGNRWSIIVAHLPGRTDNEIKNYWNSHLSRRLYSFSRLAAGENFFVNHRNVAASPGKPRCGRISRAAMKKNSMISKSKASCGTSNSDQISIVSCSPSPGPSPASESTNSSSLSFEFDWDAFDEVLGPDDEIWPAAKTSSGASVVNSGESGAEKKFNMEMKEYAGEVEDEKDIGLPWDLEGLEAMLREEETTETWPWLMLDTVGESNYINEELMHSWLHP